MDVCRALGISLSLFWPKIKLLIHTARFNRGYAVDVFIRTVGDRSYGSNVESSFKVEKGSVHGSQISYSQALFLSTRNGSARRI